MALLAQVWAGSAQVYWSKQIDWEHDLEAFGYLTDSYKKYFLAVAGTFNLDPYYERAMLTRFDSSGNVLGSNVFLPPDSYTGGTRDAIKLDEENTLVLSSFYHVVNGISNGHLYLTKVKTLTGDTLWSKRYVKPGWHFFGRMMKKTKDGGYAIIGKTFLANNTGYEKIFLIKTDSLFNESYRKEYTTNGSQNQNGWAITETHDNGMLLVCSSTYNGVCSGCNTSGIMADLILIKTDAFGNFQWTKEFSSEEWQQYGHLGFDIQSLKDSTYLVFGNKYYHVNNQNFADYSRYSFIRISMAGVLLDSMTYGGGDGTLITNTILLEDLNFLVTGAEKDSSFTGIGQTGVLLKVSRDMEIYWKKEYYVSPPGFSIYDKFNDAIEMPDHGFIICGRTYSDSTYQNGWILRVDSLGCLEPGCHINSPVEDPPAPEQDISITLSPNPTSGQVQLALTHLGAVLLGLRVLDVQGRVVSDMQYLRSAGWRECEVDLGGEPAGVYMVQVRSSEGWGVRKIVKQ